MPAILQALSAFRQAVLKSVTAALARTTDSFPQNPLDAAPENESRSLLAQVLASSIDPTMTSPAQSRTEPQSTLDQVGHALDRLEVRHLERKQREVRAAIAEAERRGDQTAIDALTLEKMKLDRVLRDRS